MISRSLIELTKCRWREFRREPSGFFWVIFMPIFGMVVFGLAFSNPKPESYSVGLVSDRVPQTFKDAIQLDEHIRVKPGPEQDVATWFKRGEIVLGLSWKDGGPLFLFDPANPESTRARHFINSKIQTIAGRIDPLPQFDQRIETEGGRYVDFLIPGLLALSIMSSSLFGIGMTIVSNRKENLLKRYLATPMQKFEFLISHIFGRIMVLAFEFTAVMITGYVLFRFVVYGNFFTFAGFSILGAGTFTAIAMVCASRTASIPMMAGLLNIISIPMMLMSGVFFSKSNFPEIMHPIINILPLTVLADGLRKIALEGLSITGIGFEMGVLIFYLAAATIIARFSFKWY